jgi:hypothetical protein
MLTANILKKGEAFSGYRKKLSTAEDIYQRERFFNGENYFPQKKPEDCSAGFFYTVSRFTWPPSQAI